MRIGYGNEFAFAELIVDEQIRRVLRAEGMGDTAEMFMRNWFPASMLTGANEIVDRFRAMVLGTTPRGLAGVSRRFVMRIYGV